MRIRRTTMTRRPRVISNTTAEDRGFYFLAHVLARGNHITGTRHTESVAFPRGMFTIRRVTVLFTRILWHFGKCAHENHTRQVSTENVYTRENATRRRVRARTQRVAPTFAYLPSFDTLSRHGFVQYDRCFYVFTCGCRAFRNPHSYKTRMDGSLCTTYTSKKYARTIHNGVTFSVRPDVKNKITMGISS